MRLNLLIALLLVCSSALAEIKITPVDYQTGETRLRGALVYDDQLAGGRTPGVLVFPEWWGANDYAKSRARMLAEMGYVAFVADMYGDGKVTDDPAEAQSLATKLYQDPKELVARATAALNELRRSNRADDARIGAIGYCMGGTVALQLARSGADIESVVVFHGGLANKGEPAQKINAAVLVCNGAADKMVSAEEVNAFMEEMRSLKADWQLVQYGGAMHSFTNPAADKLKAMGTIGYDQQADLRSWKLMVSHLAETLGHEPALGSKTPTASR